MNTIFESDVTEETQRDDLSPRANLLTIQGRRRSWRGTAANLRDGAFDFLQAPETSAPSHALGPDDFTQEPLLRVQRLFVSLSAACSTACSPRGVGPLSHGRSSVGTS